MGLKGKRGANLRELVLFLVGDVGEDSATMEADAEKGRSSDILQGDLFICFSDCAKRVMKIVSLMRD